MPMSELGKPSTESWGVVITEPQDTMGLMLHDGMYDGLSRILIFSTVSVNEAINPITPAISTHHALAGGTVAACRESGAESLTGSPVCADAAAVTTPGGAPPRRYAAAGPGTSPTIFLILSTSA